MPLTILAGFVMRHSVVDNPCGEDRKGGGENDSND
jgi:hypothetical protein